MEWVQWDHIHGSNDFMVPSEVDRLELIPSSTEEDWFQWDVNRLENDRLRKYIGTSEKDNLKKNYGTIVLPLNESKVPQVPLGEGSSSLSPCEDDLLLDCSMRTDDCFSDLPDFEIQTSMQNLDDIFLDSLPDQELMHLDYPYEYESMHISESMHSPLNWRFSLLEDSDALMKDLSGGEDSASEDPNFGDPFAVDQSPISEDFITNVGDEPACMEATVLQELQNVMLQLNSTTRICIRDALYRLANSSKGRNLDLCQSESFEELPFHSDIYCETPRQELKTNEIDRAVAALMFDRSDCNPHEFSTSHPFFWKKETEAASGSGSRES